MVKLIEEIKNKITEIKILEKKYNKKSNEPIFFNEEIDLEYLNFLKIKTIGQKRN